MRLDLFRPVLAVCAATLLLGACMGPPAEAAKEPVISYSPVTHDVYYARYTVLPSEAEENRLTRFLAENGNNPGGNIALLAAAPDEAKTAERLGELRRQLERHGHVNLVIVADTTVPEDRVRVSASTVQVSAPDCPDWSNPYMANYRNAPLSNLGCAHAVNLSKMVQDPNDLVAGKSDNRPDAERGRGVIEAYRTPPVAGGGNTTAAGGQ